MAPTSLRHRRSRAAVSALLAVLAVVALSACGQSTSSTMGSERGSADGPSGPRTTATTARNGTSPSSGTSAATSPKVQHGAPPQELAALGYPVLFAYPAGTQISEWDYNSLDPLGVSMTFRGPLTAAACVRYLDLFIADGVVPSSRSDTATFSILDGIGTWPEGTARFVVMCDATESEVYVVQRTDE